MIPNDPNMLLSMINTYLRDRYDSLETLADDLSISLEDITSRLASIGYEYDSIQNRFILK